jgi:primosomal protein N' (replication factor Y)
MVEHDAPAPAELWAEVAVPVPVRGLLTYRVPDTLRERVRPGARALVALGSRRMTGIVVSTRPAGDPAPAGLRPLVEILDQEPLISEELLSFVLRAAEYYLCPPGEALRAALPPGMSGAERGGGVKRRAEPATVPCARLADAPPGDASQLLARAPARLRLLSRLPLDGTAVPVDELRRFNPRASHLLALLAEQGWVELVRRPPPPDPLLSSGAPPERVPPEPTPEQARALEAIGAALDARGYRGFLLHGVTGSGKTEVYLRAIARVLAGDRSALVLVPEIALTPQLVARFRARFGDLVGVLHSGLTQRQRLREWSRVRAGDARVAIGARSAVFAPVERLGIVVVDEEHDPSFKQDEGFRYNGRDLALMRAQRAGAVAVLGSATPALETYFNSERGKLERLVLPSRVTPRPLPRVEIVDLRRHRSGPGGQSVVTGPLAHALERSLDDGLQSIVFLNRRGYAPVLSCGACGEAVRCRSCSVALTFHQRTGLLECHYCAHGEPVPEACPACAAADLFFVGAGTEQAEELLREVLGPRARVARLDSDVAPGRASEGVLDKMRAGETNVLVGTQLVTKGHDLPGVSVVGVLLADASLHIPDFRATERTFQLLTQVAGRAGRGEVMGTVIIQTYLPTHPAIRCAASHDYETFYRFEMAARTELDYPPLSRLAAIRLSARDEARARDGAQRLADLALASPEVTGGRVQVRGPAPAPLAMIRGRYRYRILLKTHSRAPLRSLLARLAGPAGKLKGQVRISVDIDPVNML